MKNKYQILITEFEPLTEEEKKEQDETRRLGRDTYPSYGTTLSPLEGYKERRVTYADLSFDEFQAVKKAIIDAI